MKNKGQAIVEFAFVVPLLVLLLAGIIKFGLFFNAYINTAFASREGARIASLDTNATQQTVTLAIQGTMSTTNSAITISSAPPRITGSPVTVKIVTNYTFKIPLISHLISPNPYPITSSTTMRSE